MDTKLKNYRNKYAKASAFALTVLFLSLVLVFSANTFSQKLDYNDIFKLSYYETNKFGMDLFDASNQVQEATKELVLSEIKPKDKTSKPSDSESNSIDLSKLYYKQNGRIYNLNDVSYYFYLKQGNLEITNSSLNKILKQNYYVGHEGNNLKFGPKAENNEYIHYYLNSIINDWYVYDNAFKEKMDMVLYISYDDKVLIEKSNNFLSNQDILKKLLSKIIILMSGSFILVAYLSIVAGRKPEDDELHPWKLDKIYGEIILFFCSIITLVLILTFTSFIDYTEKLGNMSSFFPAVFAMLLSILGLLWLSLCRKFKNKPRRYMFFCTGIVFDLVLKPIKALLKFSKTLPGLFKEVLAYFDKTLYAQFNVTQRIHRLSCIYLASMVILSILNFVFGLISFYFMIILISSMIFLTLIFVRKSKESFDEINKGFDKGYRESLKAEKMRVDLITNVSHDLKTPLTSIISYTDLLKAEEMSDTAKDYVSILEQKAKRLNTIVSDLFELSKSTSGNLQVELEAIDLKKLIEQTFADMEDRISPSTLDFVTKLPKESIMIYADGKKLYRVFQNIFDNVLKYSMDNTRVYVSLDVADHVATVTVKNIASYPMNFTDVEILERFTRGDSSRTTEGSGLGLSIAESFVNNCHGQFKVDIDGDLFKVTISFDTL